MDNKDYKDIRTEKRKSIRMLLKEKLEKLEKEYNAKFEPFCYTCAKYDIQDVIDTQMKELQRNNENVDNLTLFQIFERISPKKYAGDNHKIVSEHEVYDEVIVEGLKKKQLRGYNIDFKCKKRGCNRSIFVPVEEYQKLYAKKNS